MRFGVTTPEWWGRYGHWHRWFAWHPVCVNGQLVWLEAVDRRRREGQVDDYWEYRS